VTESQSHPPTAAAGNDFFPMFTDAEMARRHARVRGEMRERGIDALIVYGSIAMGNSQGQVNVQYLARYAAVIETFLVFPADGEPTLLFFVPFHVPNARAIAYVQDIRPGPALPNVVRRIEALRAEGGRIGLVGPGATPGTNITLYSEHQKYLDERLPRARFVNATGWFDDLRLIKSAEELALLERAGAITDLAHEEMFRLTRPGVSHSELRRAIEALAARHGATFPFAHIGSFSLSAPTGYYPEFYPTETRIAQGSLVMTEFALGFGNYWSKLWGSFFVGQPSAEYRRLFEVAARVHDSLVAGLKPGMTGHDVNAFLAPIVEAGFDQPANVLVGGWSSMNHAPAMGALPSSLSAPLTSSFLDYPLKPGHALTLHAWLSIPNTAKGLWVGSSGAITQTGFQSYNRYPISSLRIAG
jgi:Xaa-Pro aminopeptidase